MIQTKEINYSFIIPHRNSPLLLRRCVDSIPQRDDVEIIVVDDNSDDDKKPIGMPNNVKVVLLDEYNSKGAGRARNMGLANATGKWLLFADADDFYVDGVLDILDGYCDKDDLEILYFSCKGVDTNTLEPSSCADGVQKRIEQYDGSERSLNIVKYQTHAPWCKMIRRDYVLKYLFFYDEVKKGNDVKFSYLSAYFAKRIEVIKDRLYVYTYNPDGVTHAQRSLEGSLSIRLNQAKSRMFLKYIGLPNMHSNIPFYNTSLAVLKHMGVGNFVMFMWKYFTNIKLFTQESYDYVQTLETIKNQIRIRGLIF